MYFPTTRVLTVLELLQSRSKISGPELAERLEVDIRTVRRYIMMLQSMGIPVEGGRGRYGAYYLRPGFKLPPLMFTNDEAFALTLGLLTVRKLGMADAAPAVEGALAKLERVLPRGLSDQVQGLKEVLSVDVREVQTLTQSAIIATLAAGARLRRRVWVRYGAYDAGATEREIDPYGLVCRAGYWYTVGYCHLRKDLRNFRLDRVEMAELRDETFTRPENFDCLEFVVKSLPMTPARWFIELWLETSLEEAQRYVSPALAVLEPVPDHERMVSFRCYVNELDWMAHIVAGWPFPINVRQPAELREELKRLADVLKMQAERTL
uniref:Transcriptional regulator n=1 Tax=Thermosporothrix sp. COM3 TaxID=2490863 RepID=A0A455SL39_9CHLR|nr:transcriptional regulator [Thermosporothrix sp. COM3]